MIRFLLVDSSKRIYELEKNHINQRGFKRIVRPRIRLSSKSITPDTRIKTKNKSIMPYYQKTCVVIYGTKTNDKRSIRARRSRLRIKEQINQMTKNRWRLRPQYTWAKLRCH